MAVSFRLDQLLGANQLEIATPEGKSLEAFHTRVKNRDKDDSGLSDRDIDGELAGAEAAACRGMNRDWAFIAYDVCLTDHMVRDPQSGADKYYRPIVGAAQSARTMMQATDRARTELVERLCMLADSKDLSTYLAKLAANPRLLSLLDQRQLQTLVCKAKEHSATGDAVPMLHLTSLLLVQIERTAKMEKLPANERRIAIDNYAHALLFLPQGILAQKLVEHPDAVRALPVHRRSNVLDYVYFVANTDIGKFRAVVDTFADLWIARDKAIIDQRFAPQ